MSLNRGRVTSLVVNTVAWAIAATVATGALVACSAQTSTPDDESSTPAAGGKVTQDQTLDVPASAETKEKLGISKWKSAYSDGYVLLGVDESGDVKGVLKFTPDGYEFDGEQNMDLEPFAPGTTAQRVLDAMVSDFAPETAAESAAATPQANTHVSVQPLDAWQCHLPWTNVQCETWRKNNPQPPPKPQECKRVPTNVGGRTAYPTVCHDVQQPPPAANCTTTPGPNYSKNCQNFQAPTLVNPPQNITNSCNNDVKDKNYGPDGVKGTCASIIQQANRNTGLRASACSKDKNSAACQSWRDQTNADDAYVNTLGCKPCISHDD